MTTRLLAAFNVLDGCSKVLDRHAKKDPQVNYERGQYYAYCKPDTAQEDGGWQRFGVRRTSKLKDEEKVVSEEKVLKTLRVSVTSALITSSEDIPCVGSDEVIRGRINIRPFTDSKALVGWTSATNIESSTGNSCKDNEEEGMGVMIMPLKKPQISQSSRQSSHRMKWSSEVEKVPCSYALNKDTSKALVGRCLGYTDTSHWCTSSLNNAMTHSNVRTEENSVKEFIHEQPSQSEGVHFKHVPLSFDDELEKTNVKVLTPRSGNIYEALPIVSETYPVVYSTSQHYREPFSSPGFHSLNSPEPAAVRQCSVYSAIVRITESMQAERLLQGLKARRRGEVVPSPTFYSASGPGAKRKGGFCMNPCLFSADGNVNRSPDPGQLPLHNRGHVSSVQVSACTNKGPLIPLTMPKVGSVSSARVGPVINGMNPSQKWDPGKIPRCCNPLQGTPWRKLSNGRHTPIPQTQQNTATVTKNKNFLLISKSAKNRQNGVNSFITKLQSHIEDWGKKETEAQSLHKNSLHTQVREHKSLCVHGTSFTRPPNNSNCDFGNTPLSGKGTVVAEHTGDSTNTVAITAGTESNCKVSSSNASLHCPHPINIPTAENVN